ncbi:hypothetical protein [Geodermatophilus sp. SYSU D01105]
MRPLQSVVGGAGGPSAGRRDRCPLLDARSADPTASYRAVTPVAGDEPTARVTEGSGARRYSPIMESHHRVLGTGEWAGPGTVVGPGAA